MSVQASTAYAGESHRWAWMWRGVAFAPVTLWAWLAFRSHAPGGAGLADLLGVLGAAWFGLALLGHWAWKHPLPVSTRWLIGCGLTFRLCGLWAQPVLEDDHYRFLWDGWQLRHGRNPYASMPSDWFGRPDVPPEYQRILDSLNHPEVPTVYGPVAQLGFGAAAWVAPATLWPWKIQLLLAELGLWWALARLARVARLDPGRRQQMWLLLTACPLAVLETSFNAHPEMLAVAAAMGALALLALGSGSGSGSSGFQYRAGALLAVAMAAKAAVLPLVPLLFWRGGRRVILGSGIAWFLLYAPFCWQGGRAEFAGLQIMARDWEFNSTGYAVLAAGFGPEVARGMGAGAVLLALISCGRKWVADEMVNETVAGSTKASINDPVTRGDVLFGVVWLFAPTANPWYLLWLLPFVAYRPTGPGLMALFAVSLAYVTYGNLGVVGAGFFEHPDWVRPVEIGLVVAAFVWEWRAGCGSKRFPISQIKNPPAPGCFSPQ